MTSASEQDAPHAHGLNVHLRALTPDDYPFLYVLEHAPDRAFRWRLRGHSVEPERSIATFWEGILCAHLIIPNASLSDRLALVIAYDSDLRNGHTKIALAAMPAAASLLVAEGCALFLSYLFDVFPLRKLYAEVPGYNLPKVPILTRPPFEREGSFRDHDFFGGCYWDREWFSLTRSSWAEHLEQLLARPTRWDLLGASTRRSIDRAAPTNNVGESLAQTRAFLASRFGATALEPDTRLEPLGLDSLDSLELLIFLEGVTGQEWPEKLVTSFRTIGDVLDMVKTKSQH